MRFFAFLTVVAHALILEDSPDREWLRGKTLGYYTGSFDPLHRGHERFAKGVLEAGVCDYVLVVPAWGGDTYKNRAPVTQRIAMLRALFATHPKIIVTSLSPQEMQSALAPLDAECVGLLGSDRALSLSPKHLTVFMRGLPIPPRHARTTIGSIIALPASRFAVGLRKGDSIESLGGFVGNRPICYTHIDESTDLISSTEVKRRLKEGLPVTDLIDTKVLEIIQTQGLYDSPIARSESQVCR